MRAKRNQLNANMKPSADTQKASAWRLVILLCSAQVLVQIGAFFWPALLPKLMTLWRLSNSEAGWITSAFYGAYMLAVPVLVTLTDRIDPKRIYLFGVAVTIVGHLAFSQLADGFWSALACRIVIGIGWAGTYMTGLKLLADRLDARMMSRATAGHAASIGISGAASFALGDWLAELFGWPAAFLTAGVCAAIAWVAIAVGAPRQQSTATKSSGASSIQNFLSVFRNRSAMAYAFAYSIHTLEMSALRGWAVAFLAWVAVSTGTSDASLSPAVMVTMLGLVGTFASVIGNECSIRFGRSRLVQTAMLASIVIGATIGFIGSISYSLASAMVIAYGLVIWLDSSSLTAGAAGTAEPERRGATLAVHSMLGYTGGFIGPLLIGWTLDLSGGASQVGWGVSFAVVALFMIVALLVFRKLKPKELPGDLGLKY
jgi:predicted MFS family arabinose efflux permease